MSPNDVSIRVPIPGGPTLNIVLRVEVSVLNTGDAPATVTAAAVVSPVPDAGPTLPAVAPPEPPPATPRPADAARARPILDDVALWERERVRRRRRDTARVKMDLLRIIEGMGIDRIEDARPAGLLGYLRRRRDEGVTGRTCNKLQNTFSTLLEVVRVHELGQPHPRITENWARRLPRCDIDDAGSGSRALSWDEVGRLLDHLRGLPKNARHPVGPRVAAYTLLAHTGLRVSEARGLRVDNVSDDGKRLTLGRETKAKRARVVPLTGEASRVVRELVAGAGDDGRLFARGTFPIQRTLITDCAAAGVDVKSVGFHSFRKAFAGRCAAAGVGLVNTSKIMGHCDPRLTAAVYSNPNADDLTAAMARF